MNSSPEIIIDCDKMKYPNTGLYHFCFQLLNALHKHGITENRSIGYFAPKIVTDTNVFDENIPFINRKIWNTCYLNLPKNYKVWHSAFQMGKFWPRNVKSNIITIHDLNYLYDKADKKHSYYYNGIKRNIDRVDKIVTISEFSKHDIIDHFDIGNKEVEVIYNGCNIYNNIIEEPALKPDRQFIFSLGTILPKKNFHVLPALLKDNDYELIIAGNISNYFERILEEARKWNVEDRVNIIGPISEGLKHWYLKNCLAFAFPSIAEGFGLPVVEAMYYGKPIFLSSYTSLPEVGGDLATYFNKEFDPEGMRLEFIEGMERYNNENLERKIKQHALKFSWDEAAEKYWKIYKEFL